MSKPVDWPFDKFLTDGETLVWSQKAGRIYWVSAVTYLVLCVSSVALVILTGSTFIGAIETYSIWASLPGLGFLTLTILFGLYAFAGLMRLAPVFYALTDRRVLIVHVFPFRTCRSLPERWFYPNLVSVCGGAKSGTIRLPCPHKRVPGFSALRQDYRFLAHGSHPLPCAACWLGSANLIGIDDPKQISALITKTLGP